MSLRVLKFGKKIRVKTKNDVRTNFVEAGANKVHKKGTSDTEKAYTEYAQQN